MKYFTVLIILLTTNLMNSQSTDEGQKLPFRDITTYPDLYNAETVVARMIDGLGFRFYWATEGLRAEDLAFRPTLESRSSEETIDHIMGLSNVILNCIKTSPISAPVKKLHL